MASSEMVAIGDVRAVIPREGEFLAAAAEPKPKYYVSTRARDFWGKLAGWYGASKIEDFGDWPPSEVCKALDAVSTRADMGEVLEAVLKEYQRAFPPSMPELLVILRRYGPPPIDWPKLQADLGDYILRTRGAAMSLHQRIGVPRWQWYQNGVFVPPSDGVDGFFVAFSEMQP
jgi:hypothetical protein